MTISSPLPPTSRGNNVIYAFLDRLTKVIRLAATKPDCTAAAVPALSHENVYLSHRLPKNVVCDSDSVMFSQF